MTIHLRGEWAYDHNITAWEGKFFWHVVRFKLTVPTPIGGWLVRGLPAGSQRPVRRRNGTAWR